jgi:hypothetical protein
MDDARQILQESAAMLDRMQSTDRDRARQRMRADGPGALTSYEVGLLGDEYRAHVRQRAASQKAAQEAARYRATVTRALRPDDITFRNDLLRRLNQHAIDLVVRHGLTVRVSPDGGGWQSGTTVCVPLPVSEAAYAVTLHEMGHALCPDADSRQYANLIEGGHIYAVGGEVGAWRWATKHALVWTCEMQERLYESLLHHPAYRGATEDERWDMSTLLRSACLRVMGKTWTFGQLDERCANLRERP